MFWSVQIVPLPHYAMRNDDGALVSQPGTALLERSARRRRTYRKRRLISPLNTPLPSLSLLFASQRHHHFSPQPWRSLCDGRSPSLRRFVKSRKLPTLLDLSTTRHSSLLSLSLSALFPRPSSQSPDRPSRMPSAVHICSLHTMLPRVAT